MGKGGSMAQATKFKALLAGLFIAGFQGGAVAAPVTLGGANDSTFGASTYWGGTPTNSYANRDIIGTDTIFGVESLVASRDGTTLNVVISTYYSGVNIGNLGTSLGALFLGPVGVSLAGADPHHPTDTFAADPSRFTYALDFNTTPTNGIASQSGGSSSSTLYSLTGAGDVKTSFAPTGYIYRAGQAVDVTDARKLVPSANVGSGDWAQQGGVSGNPGTITFNIYGFFANGGLGTTIFSTGMLLGWAMTCANDVILAPIRYSAQSPPDVPLPPGLILLLSSLMGMGFIGRLRVWNSKHYNKFTTENL